MHWRHDQTPILSADELQSLGSKIVVCPVDSLMVTAQAVRHLGKTFLSKGRIDHLIPTVNFEDLKEILEVKKHLSSRSSLKKIIERISPAIRSV
jgi:2-methylisocitrate lyase-like PEP mutase family enzyme